MVSNDNNMQLSHSAHAAQADMSGAEGAPQAEHTHAINTWVLMKWLIAIILVLALAIAGLIQLFQVVKLHKIETMVEVDTLSHAEYLKHRQNMKSELSWGTEKAEFRAVDANHVQIPIGAAMEDVVNAYSKQPGSMDGTLKQWANPVGKKGSDGASDAPATP